MRSSFFVVAVLACHASAPLAPPANQVKEQSEVRDRDDDCIADDRDGCPERAEDYDVYRDDDGCPDLDNDDDGVADATDPCAYEAGSDRSIDRNAPATALADSVETDL